MWAIKIRKKNSKFLSGRCGSAGAMGRVSLGTLLVISGSLAQVIKGFVISVVGRETVPRMSNSQSDTSTHERPPTNAVPGTLVDHAVAWAAANGLGMVVNNVEGVFTSTHLPFSLLPYGEMQTDYCNTRELITDCVSAFIFQGYLAVLPFHCQTPGRKGSFDLQGQRSMAIVHP